MAVLWPAVLYFHGLYQIKRGRSRIDEFFAIVFSVLIASAFTLGATLYVRVYYRYQPEVSPDWEYSQAVFALFAVLDVLLLSLGRRAVRAWQESRWAAGEDLTRVVVAGTGELGRTVADALLAHRKLGYRVVGFLGEGPGADGHAGLPVIGAIDDARDAMERSQADQLYVALPLEDHARLVPLVKSLSNECVDIKVVPDVVQYATIKAVLEDLDGIPIISLNEVPLQGWSSMVKRLMDVTVSSLPAARARRRSRPAAARPVRSSLRRQGADPPPPGAHDARREDVPDLQVPHHGGRGGEGDRPGLRDLGRPAPHPDRRLAPAAQPRRAPAAPERLPRRHEPGGAPPGAAALRPAVPGADPRVHAPSPREERDDRVGPGQRLARQHLDREADRVRPLLHRELVPPPRSQDPDPDPLPRLRPAHAY